MAGINSRSIVVAIVTGLFGFLLGAIFTSLNIRSAPHVKTRKELVKPAGLPDVIAILADPTDIIPPLSERPSVGSKEWWKQVEKNEQQEDAEFEKNKVQPGQTITAGNLRFENIQIARDKQWIVLSVDVANISTNRIVTPFSTIHSAMDEFENDLGKSREDIEDDKLKEIQPGDKGTLKLAVHSLLDNATHGTVRIRTQDANKNGKNRSICWTLDFDFPAKSIVQKK